MWIIVGVMIYFLNIVFKKWLWVRELSQLLM